MLEALRKSSKSWLVRVLFGLLIISFLGWGMGDVVRSWNADQPAITIGGEKIDSRRVAEEYKRETDKLRPLLGDAVDPALLRDMGVLDAAINQVVLRGILDRSAKDLGLRVSDEALKRRIADNPVFHDKDGKFDVSLYRQTLSRAGLSEHDFEQIERDNLLRSDFVDGLLAGTRSSAFLTEALFRLHEERRIAEFVTVKAASFPAVALPDQSVLRDLYQAEQKRFMSPEMRKLKVIFIRPGDVSKPEAITDEMIKEAYDQRHDEFSSPEKRSVQQILLDDQQEADKARAMIAAGSDLAAIARQVADKPKTVDSLGWLGKSDLPADLSAVVFSLNAGQIGQPVQSPFGFHVFRVTDIVPPRLRPLMDVKDQIRQDLAMNKANDALYQTATALEDALGSGADLDEIGQRLSLSVKTISPVDAQGRDAMGQPANDLPNDPKLLQAARLLQTGEVTSVIEMQNGGYAVAQAVEVIAAAPKPFETVQAEVAALWQNEQKQKAARDQAERIAGKLQAGQNASAAVEGLTPQTTKPFTRAAFDKPITAAAAMALFQAKPGAVTTTPIAEGFIVARLKSIIPADPKTPEAKDKLAALSASLAEETRSDVFEQFIAAQRQALEVTINRDVIEKRVAAQ